MLFVAHILLFFGDPPATDAWRLDPLRQASCACRHNRAYREHLEWMHEHFGGDDVDHAERMAELDRRHQVWHHLLLAGLDGYPDYMKSEFMAVVRDTIGWDAYQNGELPEPVPREWLWHGR